MRSGRRRTRCSRTLSGACSLLALCALACSSADDGDGQDAGAGGQGGGAGEAGESSGAGSGGDAGDGDAGSSGTAGSAGSAGSAGQSGASGGAGAGGGSGNAGSAGSSGASGSSASDACGNAEGQLFPPEAPWNTPVDEAQLASDSDAIIAYLQDNHDTAARFQIDFSLELLEAEADTERVPFMPTGDFYEPDCDPAPVPLPEGGAIEGESSYACESDGDCHLLVLERAACRLYEMWRANQQGDQLLGGCLAVWDIDRVYPETLRGDFCTSADAAGLPIAPLLFTADEVHAGEVPHAIRFILPNQHIRELRYVRPGTHATSATSGPMQAPPYAARLRLRADADLSELSEPARVVAEGLQRYGMILADGGNLTFTARSDRSTDHSWEEVELGPHDLKALAWSDFEVIDAGQAIDWESGSCEREPIEQ